MSSTTEHQLQRWWGIEVRTLAHQHVALVLMAMLPQGRHLVAPGRRLPLADYLAIRDIHELWQEAARREWNPSPS